MATAYEHHRRDLEVGDIIDLTLGHAVPGGHVLGHAHGHTLFVRHGIPGEEVRVRVSEVQRKAIRADVIAVHRASPHRVAPPCHFAGICGGCDFQHIELAYQREMKSDMLSDALRRQARMDERVVVEPVPGSDDGLRWRSRVRWQFDSQGNRGFFRHRSHEVVAIDDCLIAEIDATESEGPFSQVHRGIAPILQTAVTDFASPQPGETWWDLFGGSGLFARALAERGAIVDVVDSSESAIALVRTLGNSKIRGHHAVVQRWLRDRDRIDGVIADPPRAGLGAPVVAAIAGAQPRIVVLVSCEPVTFARDLAAFGARNYRVTAMRAFDAFPMTHHVEAVAALVPEVQAID